MRRGSNRWRGPDGPIGRRSDSVPRRRRARRWKPGCKTDRHLRRFRQSPEYRSHRVVRAFLSLGRACASCVSFSKGPMRPKTLATASTAVALTYLIATSVGQAKITEYPLDPSATPIAQAMARRPGPRPARGVLGAAAELQAGCCLDHASDGLSNRRRSLRDPDAPERALPGNPNNAPDSGSESRGPSIRGARDVVIMRVDLRVPTGDNCLSFDFRFLSEEFPEFVNDDFNDAFIAELGHSTWSAATNDDPTITAPDNFARRQQGQPDPRQHRRRHHHPLGLREGHHLRRRDPPACGPRPDQARAAAAVPVDLRPGRPDLRLGGLPRQAAYHQRQELSQRRPARGLGVARPSQT